MIKCPACSAQIDSDFGMISCPKCSAVFMVEMDGSIQELGEVENTSHPAEDAVESAEEASMGEPTVVESTVVEPSTVEPTVIEETLIEPTIIDDPFKTPEESSAEDIADGFVSTEQAFGEVEPAETEYSENFMDVMDNPTPEPRELDPNDPLGVTAFDQSEASQTPDGLYYYDVKVNGLDSAQIREHVIDALSDTRFDWTPEDIKKNISAGELHLKNLNPVKAVLVVIKLQPLDVEVEWSQKLYTDETVQVEKDAE